MGAAGLGVNRVVTGLGLTGVTTGLWTGAGEVITGVVNDLRLA